MPLVTQWTGVETRALREAARMTLAEFAQKLGVSDRAVAKWEAAKSEPRMVSQAALDTMLAQADANVRGRFVGLITATQSGVPQQLVEPAEDPVDASEYVRHPTDGKMMARVPGGIFLAGEAGDPVWVDEFYIDVFETTNADYSRFVAATGYQTPRHWDTDGRCPRSMYDHPVVEVSWNDATAYAEWAGKALPSAEQWEKAARGTSGAVYPWGDRPTVAKCNVRETRVEQTTSVSRYHSGVSPYGVYDMVGNVWEWCSTPTTRGRYELKGSAFSSPLFRGMPSSYNDADDFMQDDDTGFRCIALPNQISDPV
ncbi:SUMF1/EgtB/PvdO family nonheme iron enzyme [Streptomyces sp. NPDC057966]|uniref:SUMF1/EgtB/PvdO family nonheme iron enzyme n=1 Tax=Streptomyces sp. NPDC057966 TaxID=3346292 RepID=UPI0036E38AB6